MTTTKKIAQETAAKASCCGTCDCTGCSCGCPKNGCRCQAIQCACGCRPAK